MFSEQSFLSNEYCVKFQAFGDWLKIDNDKVPPRIYVKPPVVLQSLETVIAVPVPTIECGGRSDSFVLASETKRVVEHVVESISDGLSVPKGLCNSGECSNQIEVSSFARLLAHSLKDECHNKRVSEPAVVGENSIRCVKTSLFVASESFGPLPSLSLNNTELITQPLILSLPENKLGHIQSIVIPNLSSCVDHVSPLLSTPPKLTESIPSLIILEAQSSSPSIEPNPFISKDLVASLSTIANSASTFLVHKRKDHPKSPEPISKKSKL